MKKQLPVLITLLLVWSFNAKALKTDPTPKKDSSNSILLCTTTINAPSVSCNMSFTLSGSTGTSGNTGYFSLVSGTGTLVSTGSVTASYTPGVNEGAAVIAFHNNAEDGCTGIHSVATKTIITSAALTPGPISGNLSVCQNSTNTYTIAAEASATSYSWTFPTGCSIVSSTSVTITEQFGAASGNVMVMGNNACGSSANTTLSVTVNDFPIAPVAIIGSTLLCSNANTGISYSVAPVANTTTYTWTLPAGGSITSGTGTNAITANLGPAGGTISVAATNTCGTGNPTSTTLVIDTMPANPGVITGVGSVCPGQTGASYSVAHVTHATSYVWTLPTGGTIASGNNTNSITVNYSAGASSGNVYVSAANAACNSGTSPALLVTIYSLPSVAINSPTLCVGTSSVVTAFASGTSGPYTYTWSTGATGSSISSPSVTTNYTVTATDFNGCRNSTASTVVVHPLPNVQINGMTAICIGSTDLLTASGANTYTWNTSATSTAISVNPTVNANYQVTGTDGNSCVNSATVGVIVNALPTVTVNSATICAGSTATLTANGAISYIWNTSAIGATITASPTVTTNYTVTGTDINSCTNTAIGSITSPANPAPDICMVSTDSFFVNNIVYWDRTAYPNADSFLVYRLSAGVYLQIGATSNDSNQLTDTKRNIGGPNGGNPNISSWYYKIAVKDACGSISPMSPYHETVNFQQNNQNLTWNAYAIESPQTNPVNNYAVWRDSLGIGDWHIFVNTSGLSTNDNTYTSYPNANYRVDATPFTCTSNEARLSGNNTVDAAKVKSHSNTNNNRGMTTGLKQMVYNNNQVSVYPNPNNGSFVIEPSNNTKQTMQLYDVNGKLVLSQTISGKTNIDASSLNEGVYNISLQSNEGVVNKRLVIVR